MHAAIASNSIELLNIGAYRRAGRPARAEACGLRVVDVDFMRGVVAPAVQFPAEPLTSETSQTPVPIPQSLESELSAHVARWRAETVLVNDLGRQLSWTLERHFRTARAKVPGLQPDFRYHDLRHASARTTLDTYGHLWPDSDDSTRAAIEAVMAARADNLRTAEAGDA